MGEPRTPKEIKNPLGYQDHFHDIIENSKQNGGVPISAFRYVLLRILYMFIGTACELTLCAL